MIVLDDRVFELGARQNNTTNNEMELMAVVASLDLLVRQKFKGRAQVCLDSKYVLGGASQWIYSWAKRGWKTADGSDVKNQSLWKQVADYLRQLKPDVNFVWKYVPGHAGFEGNERVDEIASSFADGLEPSLYEGSAQSYPVSWRSRFDEIEEFKSDFRKPFNKPKKKAYYLSFVGGSVYRDDTWTACEARVKGTSGAKYKKVTSAQEEKSVLDSWGVKNKDL